MKIVINIPKELYEEIINSEDCGLHELTRAIANGTPLPKVRSSENPNKWIPVSKRLPNLDDFIGSRR